MLNGTDNSWAKRGGGSRVGEPRGPKSGGRGSAYGVYAYGQNAHQQITGTNSCPLYVSLHIQIQLLKNTAGLSIRLN